MFQPSLKEIERPCSAAVARGRCIQLEGHEGETGPTRKRYARTVRLVASGSTSLHDALLSEAALAEDWNRGEEAARWPMVPAKALKPFAVLSSLRQFRNRPMQFTLAPFPIGWF